MTATAISEEPFTCIPFLTQRVSNVRKQSKLPFGLNFRADFGVFNRLHHILQIYINNFLQDCSFSNLIVSQAQMFSLENQIIVAGKYSQRLTSLYCCPTYLKSQGAWRNTSKKDSYWKAEWDCTTMCCKERPQM